VDTFWRLVTRRQKVFTAYKFKNQESTTSWKDAECCYNLQPAMDSQWSCSKVGGASCWITYLALTPTAIWELNNSPFLVIVKLLLPCKRFCSRHRPVMHVSFHTSTVGNSPLTSKYLILEELALQWRESGTSTCNMLSVHRSSFRL